MVTRLDPLSAGLTMIECVFRSPFKAFSSSLVKFSGSGSFLVLLSARLSYSINSNTTGSVSAGAGSKVEGDRNGLVFPSGFCF